MIRNVIFDVGNVLFDYDWHKPFRDHGVPDEDIQRIGQEIFHDDIWLKWDAGLCTLEEARDYYINKHPLDAAAVNCFMDHIDEIRIDRPRVWERIPVLKSRGYGLYILSNYSRELFEAHTKGLRFMEEFDGRIVSYEVHYLKPQDEIYECLLRRYDLKAKECIFFDDRKENTDAAEKLGIEAVTIYSQEQLLDEIKKLLP
ncbi:MAG: HAD family hydrolase [Candidatus Alectryocaccobium sp.]|jgi:putative hydrolase of the HAD superfamily|nr:HAD family phosphatase [Lachnospiraceae bacterium]MDY6222086.1 HAD family phosphatase [Candidatus Alectryocaccobium sp.]